MHTDIQIRTCTQVHVNTHINTHACTHTYTNTHTHVQSKACGSCYTDAWHYSDTQALCGKSCWDKASNPQEDCPGLTDRGRGTHSFTMTSMRQGLLSIYFPSYNQVPIGVIAGWLAAPVDTSSHLTAW